MIKVQDVAAFRGNYAEGQIIKANKMLSNDKVARVDVKILKKYSFHCLVEDAVNPRYKWCVKWLDLMVYGGMA